MISKFIGKLTPKISSATLKSVISLPFHFSNLGEKKNIQGDLFQSLSTNSTEEIKNRIQLNSPILAQDCLLVKELLLNGYTEHQVRNLTDKDVHFYLEHRIQDHEFEEIKKKYNVQEVLKVRNYTTEQEFKILITRLVLSTSSLNKLEDSGQRLLTRQEVIETSLHKLPRY